MPKRKPNPLKLDPSRTTTLRNQYVADFRSRFNWLASQIEKVLVEDDWFGLEEYDPIKQLLSLNQRWKFMTDADKVDSFNLWLKEKIELGILELEDGVDPKRPWMSKYINKSYEKGLRRAYEQVNALGEIDGSDFYKGSKSYFLDLALKDAENIGKLRTLATRNFTKLKGYTAEMQGELNRILVEGLAQGQNPREIARKIKKRLGVSLSDAERLARSEVIHAHAEGQLDSFERLGVKEIGVMAEWLTADDDNVCEMCDSMVGVVLTIKEARGLLPRHPNCRCCFAPAFRDQRRKGQKWQKREVQRAIDKSVKAEHPKKKSLAAAKRASHWLGAGRKIQPRKRGK